MNIELELRFTCTYVPTTSDKAALSEEGVALAAVLSGHITPAEMRKCTLQTYPVLDV